MTALDYKNEVQETLFAPTSKCFYLTYSSLSRSVFKINKHSTSLLLEIPSNTDFIS